MLYYYQSTKHLSLANAVAFLRSIAVFAATIPLLAKTFGVNGIWSSSLVNHLCAVIIIAGYALHRYGTILDIPKDFDVQPKGETSCTY